MITYAASYTTGHIYTRLFKLIESPVYANVHVYVYVYVNVYVTRRSARARVATRSPTINATSTAITQLISPRKRRRQYLQNEYETHPLTTHFSHFTLLWDGYENVIWFRK